MTTPSSTLVNRPAAVPSAAPAPDFGPPSAPGDVGRLAHYRVVTALGAGGMGAVFLAVDEHLNRRVALKVMLPEQSVEPGARERFLREARAAAAVKHDNVVTIYQVGEDGGMPFIAMELLAGRSLSAFLAGTGRLTVPQALRIGTEVAAGLDAAHALGLIHRDIKPGNIWLEAANGRVKILDFGLAKSSDAATDGLTATGQVVGTPAFMSPEQARGKPLDARSDLFSLGTVLYLLVTGRMPFDGPTTMAVLTALAVDDPVPVRELNPDVPEAFALVIHRLLSKRPSDRPATGAAVADQLRQIERDLAGPVPARTQVVYVPIQVSSPQFALSNAAATAFADLDTLPTERHEPPRHSERKGVPIGALAAGAVLLAAAVVAGVVYLTRPASGEKAADRPAPPVPSAAAPKQPAPKAAPAIDKNDPDRKFVEWMAAHGGDAITTDKQVIGPLNMPTARFKVMTARVGPLRPITNDDLDLLRELDELRGVSYHVTEIDDAGFEKWSKFPNAANLTDVYLIAGRMTSVGFAHVGRFRGLQVLTVSASAIGDDGLTGLADLRSVYMLGLNGSKVTDAGVPALVKVSSVTHLDAGNTAVGDDGLKLLVAMPRLDRLNLQGCTNVTDAGLKHFHDKKFASVNVMHTGVTAAGVAALRAANPGCQVLSTFDPPLEKK